MLLHSCGGGTGSGKPNHLFVTLSWCLSLHSFTDSSSFTYNVIPQSYFLTLIRIMWCMINNATLIWHFPLIQDLDLDYVSPFVMNILWTTFSAVLWHRTSLEKVHFSITTLSCVYHGYKGTSLLCMIHIHVHCEGAFTQDVNFIGNMYTCLLILLNTFIFPCPG